jgi:surface adhesion protein
LGNEGDNIIQSLAGDDTLVGNAGSDTLTGGLGSDTFDYNSNNDGHDIITDFSLSEGDKLDISDLVDYQVNNNLADFVSVENIGNDSIVHIDSDGENGTGESYVSITLSNTTLSFEDLSSANALVKVSLPKPPVKVSLPALPTKVSLPARD